MYDFGVLPSATGRAENLHVVGTLIFNALAHFLDHVFPADNTHGKNLQPAPSHNILISTAAELR